MFVWLNKFRLEQVRPGPPVFQPLSHTRMLAKNGNRVLISHLLRTQCLNVLPLKPRIGQDIATHAILTVRDFLLAHFYLSGPFTCTFSKASPEFCPC